jgi:hypothetical protein
MFVILSAAIVCGPCAAYMASGAGWLAALAACPIGGSLGGALAAALLYLANPPDSGSRREPAANLSAAG